MVSPKKPWGGSEFKLESLEEDHPKTGFSFTSQCFISVFLMTEQFGNLREIGNELMKYQNNRLLKLCKEKCLLTCLAKR